MSDPLKLFDIANVFIIIFGYPLSYIEFISTFFGIVSIWLAAKQSIWSWSTGLISIISSLIIFYQVQLYSDMFLQVFFFITNIYGWIVWRKQFHEKKPVGTLSPKTRIILILFIIVSTFIFGMLMKNIHLLLPALFIHPASFPFIDTFIAMASIVATILLTRRKIDNWILWLFVDVICVFIYALKNIKFISLEYGVFCLLACVALSSWIKSIKNYKKLFAAIEQ